MQGMPFMKGVNSLADTTWNCSIIVVLISNVMSLRKKESNKIRFNYLCIINL